MIANSRQWEGQFVDEKFRLGRFLGGSGHSAVFLVERRGGDQSQTAIRFLDAKSDKVGDQLKQWEAVSKLDHPDLIQIFETGRCQIAGDDLLYVLTEYADEDLSLILPERALTADETREVLETVLSALAYIHNKGLVHGRLKPSNILAVGHAVKISSDSLRPAGKGLRGSANTAYDAPEVADGILTPAADVWSLGVTLVEVLTRRLPVFDLQLKQQPTLPEGIPQPFRGIIKNCLEIDPAARWTVAEITARLRRGQVEAVAPQPAVAPYTAAKAAPGVPSAPREAGPGLSAAAAKAALAVPSAPREPGLGLSDAARDQKRSGNWPYAIALIAAIVIVVLVARRTPPASHPAVETAPANAVAAKAASGRETVAASTTAGSRPADGQVAERIMPRVAPSAQRTIHGRFRVEVAVNVDKAGQVTEASLQSPGPSRYFARHALEAARGWKFKPPVQNGQAVASEWLVRFTFSRGSTDESAEQIRP